MDVINNGHRGGVVARGGRTLGGRPRFLGGAGSPEVLTAAAASLAMVFLFLEPFGRPRGRLAGVTGASTSASAGGHNHDG